MNAPRRGERFHKRVHRSRLLQPVLPVTHFIVTRRRARRTRLEGGPDAWERALLGHTPEKN